MSVTPASEAGPEGRDTSSKPLPLPRRFCRCDQNFRVPGTMFFRRSDANDRGAVRFLGRFPLSTADDAELAFDTGYGHSDRLYPLSMPKSSAGSRRNVWWQTF